MFTGQLVAICLAPVRGAPMQNVSEAELIAARGMTGDRYGNKAAAQQNGLEPAQEVTLIEAEALEAAQRDCELELSHAESRRNLLTAGVPLNHLVGRQFSVGPVVLEGIELCEPCKHLERLTGKKAVKALLHRGGLRARIVQSGVVRVGDAILPSDSEIPPQE